MRLIVLLKCLLFIIPLFSQQFEYVSVFDCTEYGSQGRGLVVLSDGTVILGGQFQGEMDINPGPEVKIVKHKTGNSDHFTATFNKDGKFLSGNGSGIAEFDNLEYMTADKFDNVFKVVESANAGTITITKSAKINTKSWVRIFTMPAYKTDKTSVYKIITDNDENSYILGSTSQNIVIGSKDTLKASGDQNCFIIKINNKNEIQYKLIINKGSDGLSDISIQDIICDSENNIFLGGQFDGNPKFYTTDRDTTIISSGKIDAFYGKLNKDGKLMWLKSILDNPAYSSQIPAVGVDENDNYYFATNPNTLTPNSIYKIDKQSKIIWQINIGTRGHNHKLKVLPNGDFYFMSKYYVSTDMDADPKGYYPASTIYAQYYGHYIVKYNSSGKVIWGKRLYAASSAEAELLAIDKDENIYYGGTLNEWMELDGKNGIIRIAALDNHLTSAFYYKLSKEVCSPTDTIDYFLNDVYVEDGKNVLDTLPYFVPFKSSSITKSGSEFSSNPLSGKFYIRVKNKGCTTTKNAKIQAYFAIPPYSDFSWPSGWETKIIQGINTQVQVAGLIDEVEIPLLRKNDVWYGFFTLTPVPKPVELSANNLTINILGRIVSELDPIYKETPNLIYNVSYNNNLAWNIFNISK